MRHNTALSLVRAALVGAALFATGSPIVQAATLGQLLQRAQADPDHAANCLAVAIDGQFRRSMQESRFACQAIVAQLYLDHLREREQLRLVREEIGAQRQMLAMTESRVQGGAAGNTDLLLVEVELKRWQLEEAKLSASLRRGALLFAEYLQADPVDFVVPTFRPGAWPESEDAALAILATNEEITREARTAARHSLRRAWVDYEMARRQRGLREPMVAFSDDLAHAAAQRFEIGQVSMIRLLELMRQAADEKLALVRAQTAELTAQLRVLEILDRSAAID